MIRISRLAVCVGHPKRHKGPGRYLAGIPWLGLKKHGQPEKVLGLLTKAQPINPPKKPQFWVGMMER